MSTLTIGKLAKACDVKIDTVRYYERKGLINPIDLTESGYRVYNEESVKRLKFIRKAQSLGFILEEIKELLELHDIPEADCAEVQKRAEQKVAEIEERVNDLETMKLGLEELASFCPGKGKPLSECSIIQHFYGDES